jgi:predicted outer membrane protein
MNRLNRFEEIAMRHFILAASMVTLLLAIPAWGQQLETKDTGRAAETKSANPPLTAFFAAKLLYGHQSEGQLAQFAAKQASNPDVKAMADAMAKDHASALDMLRPFAGSFATTPTVVPSSPNLRDARPVGDDRELGKPIGDPLNPQDQPQGNLAKDQPKQTGDDPAPTKGSKDRPTVETSFRTNEPAILQQILNVCAAASQKQFEISKDMLSRQKGNAFDMAYVAATVQSHISLLSELEAIEQQAQGEFQSAIRNVKATVKQHLEKAESMCEKLHHAETPSDGQPAVRSKS